MRVSGFESGEKVYALRHFRLPTEVTMYEKLWQYVGFEKEEFFDMKYLSLEGSVSIHDTAWFGKFSEDLLCFPVIRVEVTWSQFRGDDEDDREQTVWFTKHAIVNIQGRSVK